MTSLFRLSSSLSLVAIYQHDQRVCVHLITTYGEHLCIFILSVHIRHIPPPQKKTTHEITEIISNHPSKEKIRISSVINASYKV